MANSVAQGNRAIALKKAQQAAAQLSQDADRAKTAALSRRAPRGQPDTQSNKDARAQFTKDAEGMAVKAQQAIAQVESFKANPNQYTTDQIKDYSQRVVISEDTKKRQRQSRTRATSAMQERGNQQIRDSQVTELQRLGGSGSLQSGNDGPTKTSETLGTDSRVTARQAKGTAALSQPWAPEFTYTPIPVPPSTPQSRFADIATPGVGMFSGVQQKPTTAEPLAKGESAKNRISPYLIPVEERSLINRYSPEGKPVQGPQRIPQRYSVTDSSGKVRTFKDLETAKKYTARTSQAVITPIGLTDFVNQQKPSAVEGWNEIWTVEGSNKEFKSEKEANQFIKNEQEKLPFTDPKSVLYPITEPLYKYIDKSAKYNFDRLEKNGNDFETKAMAAGISFQGSMLSGFQNIREQVQTKILQKPPTPTKQISSIPTLESKALESAVEGVGVQWTYPYVTGVDVNPLSEKNPVSKYYQGAAKQWGTQTPTQNAAQLLVMAPVVAFDIATLGEGGLAAGRVATRVTTKIVSPIIAKTVSKEIFLGGLRQGVGITRKVQLNTGKFDYVKSGTIDAPVQSRGTYGNLAKKNYLDNIDFNIKPTKLKTKVDPYVSGTVSIPTKGTYGNLAKKSELDNIDFNIKPTKLKTNVDPYVSGTVDAPVVNRGSYGNLAKKNYLDNIDFNYPKLSQFQSTEISLGSGERIGKSRILKGVGFVSVITPSQGFLSKIVNLGLGGAKKEKIEQVFYHGTTPESGIAIVKSQGFDFGKSKTSSGTMFAASSKDMAYGEMGSLLKITMKKGATSIRADLAPKVVRQNPIEGWNIIRDKSKAFGFDIIENMKSPKYEGREIELLSNKNIKKIEETILNVKKPQTLSELAAVKASKLGSPFSQEKEIDGFIDIGGKPNPITLSDLAATKASKVSSPFSQEGGEKLYHYTKDANAVEILDKGFDVSKSKNLKSIFTNDSIESDSGLGGKLVKGDTNLEITMKKDAKVFDVDKELTKSDWKDIEKISKKQGLSISQENDIIRNMAKEKGSDIIKGIRQGEQNTGSEVEILNIKAIKSIKSIRGDIKGEWIQSKTTSQTAPQTLLLKEKEVEKITPVQLSMFHSYGIKLGAGRIIPPRPSIQPRVVTTSLPKEKTSQMSVTKSTQKQTSAARNYTPQTLLTMSKPRNISQRNTGQPLLSMPKQSNSASPILVSRSQPILVQSPEITQLQTPVQTLKQKPPTDPTPRLKSINIPKPKQRLVQKQVTVPPPPRRVPPPIILPFSDKNKKKKSGTSKQNDFLGNTKLDSIEGLFRRSTIIHGDKRISKQVKKDRKAKFKERGVSFFSKR